MRDQICIMIDCGEDKKIFTHKKNLNYIIEFAKKFDLATHYVKTTPDNIVSLDQIPKMFCDQNYKSASEYKIIQKNILKNPERRGLITKKAQIIRNEIKQLLMANKRITFKEIQELYKKENISISSLSNHFKHVRTELSLKGVKIVKVKNGIYKLIQES